MRQFKIKENYLLLKKWWETIDLTNYEKNFFNREIISFNQQLLRLKEKKNKNWRIWEIRCRKILCFKLFIKKRHFQNRYY